MKKDDNVYLKHILDAIERIQTYVKGKDKEKFMKEDLIQDGVIRQIEIIGEASKNLSKEFRKQYPEVPWKDISGMRDKLIHSYFGVDLEAVWETVNKDIPKVKTKIKEMIDKD